MSGTLDPALRDATQRWIAGDVDEHDKAELREVLAAAMSGSEAAVTDLADRMATSLTFGTAGLRGAVRAGANGMNRAVVVRTTAGLGSWLTDRGKAGATVVVGHDARHRSEEFAADAAGVLAAAGFDVRLLPAPLPTPVLAHAARALDAAAGVQITASHNPPQDNGYKVYLDGGVQLVTPADSEIEAAIAAAGPASDVPRSRTWSVYEQAVVDYLDRIGALVPAGSGDLRVAATPLHGVGGDTLRHALHLAGFDDVHLVASQADPDPDFPTVGFPNPEEPGATDAVLELAAAVDADLIVALDPDADRCALGIPDGAGWRMLRGDETGVLLAEHVLSGLDRREHPDPLVATTIVSSTMLRSIAAEHGARFDETFTGFKWLTRAGDGRGTGLVYAYEEALGHCVDPDHVRDKDGITTAVVACDMVTRAKAAGRTPQDELDALSTRHGVHETDQISVRVSDLGTIATTMRGLRAEPPAELAGITADTRDLLPETDALIFEGTRQAADSAGSERMRVVVRPSGTEPKLKCYLQVVADVASPGGAAELGSAKSSARTRMADLRAAVASLVGA